MARLIAISFLLLPLVEIALFIVVGRAIGVLPTLALIVLGMLGGAMLLRQQGLGVLNRMRNSVNAGTIPGREMFETMLIGFAAFLLVVPGFLTDIVALALLVPAVRRWIFTSLAGRVTVVETTATYRRHDAANDAQDPRLGGPPTIDLGDDNWQDRRQ